MVSIVGLLNQAHASQRATCTSLLEIALSVMSVCVCVCVCVRACVTAPKTINYIHLIFNLYNQLNKFVMFRNIMKQFLVWDWPL